MRSVSVLNPSFKKREGDAKYRKGDFIATSEKDKINH